MSDTLTNHRGQQVPVGYIPKLDMKRHKFALKFMKKSKALSKQMLTLKQAMNKEADAIYEMMLKDANIKNDGKGNLTITSFDKGFKFEWNMKEYMQFGDEINLAQEKINEFLKEKTANADQDLTTIVNSAFKTTSGRLDSKRILSLFSLEISNATWNDAMDLIKQSMHVNSTKRYLNIYEKDGEGAYRLVPLNFSILQLEDKQD